MSFEIKEISDRETWDKFLETARPHTFLQSWNWGEFNSDSGNEISRLGLFNESQLIGIALTILVRARRGSFLLIPHGPIFAGTKDPKLKTEDLLKPIVDLLKKTAEKKGCSFIRISPAFAKNAEHINAFKNLGFRKAPIHVHTELNWILEIDKDEDKLLKGMRKTTRNLIGRAERDGVKIEKSSNLEDVKKFWDIYQETVKLQKFTPFSLNFLEKEFLSFRKDNKAQLFFAKHENKIISAALIIFDNYGAYYHQGASTHSKIPAAYLLQWEIIKEAKNRGCKFYNLLGISPEEKKNHPWAGLSQFKKGFGGEVEEYMPAMDLVLKPSYWLNFIVEKVRKIKRGF